MLAGPIAEELIGGGDALSSVGEVIAASVLVRRAAELLGRDTIEMWGETLLGPQSRSLSTISPKS